MTPLQKSIRELRRLCSVNGIYNLSHLECLLHMDRGGSQQEIADWSRQSSSGTGQWIKRSEDWQLIEKGEAARCVRKNISYTDQGQKLIAALEKLFRSS